MLYSLLMTLDRRQKGAILAVLDLIAFALAFGLVIPLREIVPAPSGVAVTGLFVVMLGVVALGLRISGLALVQLNHYQSRQILFTFLIGAAAAAAGFAISRSLAPGLSFAVFGEVFMIFAIFSIGMRMALREIVVSIYRRRNGSIRVLVYGAGRTGQNLVAGLLNDRAFFAQGFVEDDTSLHGAVIHGLRVYPAQELEHWVKRLRVDRIVLAMPALSDSERAAIARKWQHLPCEVHAMPSLASILIDPDHVAATRPIDLSTLLGRSDLDADLPGTREIYSGKSVLVTGAGGSIGSEICLQIAESAPRHLVLLDHSEIALYDLHRKLARQYPTVEMTAVLGSVCEPGLVRHVFAQRRIDVVLHAAAYKHLPVLERNIVEGMRNNALGTQVVAAEALAHGAESFTLVSTDKAVRPRSWLGYSKRFAEMIVQDMAVRSPGTHMSIVRFGNVLGSSGSVIPLFQEQIARGGPVTLTHPDVSRYFMTVSEAVRLVLLAGSFARGGDVFVLDMGAPVPIRELARNLIKASGHTVRDGANPDGEIELRITGLRDGEKLREELLIGSDMLTTMHPKILRATELHPSEGEMAVLLRDITRAIDAYDIKALEHLIRRASTFLGICASQVPAPHRSRIQSERNSLSGQYP